MRERTIDELLLQLEELNNAANNNNNSFPLDVDAVGKKFEKILKFQQQAGSELCIKVPLLQEKPIGEWGSYEIGVWTSHVKKRRADLAEESNSPELVAVVARAMQIASGKKPRIPQMIALLLILINDKNKGIGLQVSTGEGKTMLMAMCAAIMALRFEFVDLVTSSPVLAERDAKDAELKKFFGFFSLTVGCNAEPCRFVQYRKCYSANVLYGDLHSFQGDILCQNFKGYNMRGQRPYSHVIVDEADQMLVDENLEGRLIKLSFDIPGTEHLHGLMAAIWVQLQILYNSIQYDETEQRHFFEKLDEHNNPLSRLIIPDIKAFLQITLTNAFREKLEKKEEIIPAHLSEYVTEQLPNWVDSAISGAFKHREDVEYVLRIDDQQHKRISVVDFESTGVVETNMHYSNGLHEMLQLKHGLKLSTETMTTCWESNHAFFGRYHQNLTAITGTLGSVHSRNLLQTLYPVNLFIVPTFAAKQFEQYRTILAENNAEWLTFIADMVKAMIKNGRSVLVINNCIEDAKNILMFLSNQQGISAEQIEMYIRNDKQLFASTPVVERVVEPGQVILATNLAGRGTDLKTSAQLSENGGIHVIVTFLPKNARVQAQAFGRTARQGRKGSGQLLLNKNALKSVLGELPPASVEMLDGGTINQLRDAKEHLLLANFQATVLPKLLMEDRLFNKFVQFMTQLRVEQSIKKREYSKEAMLQIEERWGIWYHKFQKQAKCSEFATNDERQSFADEEYAKFEQSLSGMLDTMELFQNPCYLVRAGCRLINKSKYGPAIEAFSNAIKLDEHFAYLAYYYRALAYICLQQPNNYEVFAKSDLAVAKNLIEEKMLPRLVGLNILTANRPESELSLQQKCKINILLKHLHNIEKALDLLKQPNPWKTQWLQDISIKELFTGGKNVPNDEIDEFACFGCSTFYELHNHFVSPKWRNCFLLVGIGAAQIGASMVFWNLGSISACTTTFINGLKDIARAIRVAMGEAFEWCYWGVEKAISYIASLLPQKIITAFPQLEEVTKFVGIQRFVPIVQKTKLAKELAVSVVEREILGASIGAFGIICKRGGKAAKEHEKQLPPSLTFEKRYAIVKEELLKLLKRVMSAKGMRDKANKRTALETWYPKGKNLEQIIANLLLHNDANSIKLGFNVGFGDQTETLQEICQLIWHHSDKVETKTLLKGCR